ncbi:MAG: tetratricopeptide repeat protein [Acidobacteriota bacterium]|nr:tetratricopeptide repeat protein [Acidobacteriota bacterium]
MKTLSHLHRMTGRAALVVLLSSVPVLAATPAAAQNPGADAQDPAADLVKQAQLKIRAGDLHGALALDQQALAAHPDSFQAQTQAGSVLDLLGRYDEARSHLNHAIALASAPAMKARALRTLAMSYAFQSDCAGTTKYEAQAYDIYLQAGDFYNAGEAANELARVCIESGDFDTAEQWYRKGHDTGLREPGIKPERVDLWNFRLEHALARLAARRGDKAGAMRHVAAARALLDKGTNPEQQVFFPYLRGYVALYTGEARTAITDLQQANQSDPFILCLIAQAHETLGDAAQATAYYRQALAHALAHNPPTAYARPLAEKKLGEAK